MATHRPSPFRDRLLSNSPDPIKSSILRDSGMGWSSSTTPSITPSSSSGSITSPLRIAKRDSPVLHRQGTDLVRRSSSSFKHVRNNNLVSKSPFKTLVPTPSTPSRPASVVFPTRRVSGEKRPRPVSMHDDAETENDRPFALKRDRKQSKTFQGLLEKEPVTKSPFKRRGDSTMPEAISPDSHLPLPVSTTPIDSHLSPDPLASLSNGPSPGRSSLVSRRLHGPRLSGSYKRERRKTVTFDERCDVVEFDRETSDEEPFEDTDDEHYYIMPNQDADEEEPFFHGQHTNDQLSHWQSEVNSHPDFQDISMGEESYEISQLTETEPNETTTFLDPNISITGLVEEMFLCSNPSMNNAETLVASTPPRITDIPTDLETEDGVPFGRSHHAERLLQHHQHSPQTHTPPPHFSPHASPRPPQHEQQTTNEIIPYPYNLGLPTHASPHGPPATPPRRSPIPIHSTPPLGRSTHIERVAQVREVGKVEAKEVEESVDKLPVSPSPMKNTSTSSTRTDGLIPKFKWPRGSQENNIGVPLGVDPFQHREHETSLDDYHRTSRDNESLDPANLSIGHSEVSLSGLERSDIYRSDDDLPADSGLEDSSILQDGSQQDHSLSLTTDFSREEEEVLAGIHNNSLPRTSHSPSHSQLPSRVASPAQPLVSPLPSTNQTGSASNLLSPRPIIRQRISKEDIRRRLTERSTSSPSPKPTHRRSDSVIAFEQTLASTTQTEEDPRENGLESDGDEQDNEEHGGISIMTAQTNINVESITVQQAERADSPAREKPAEKDLGLLGAGSNLPLNFGSKFSLGGLAFSRGNGNTASRDSLGVLMTKEGDVNNGSVSSGTSVKVGDVDVNMDMKSALDRLMDDVAGAGVGGREDSIMTEEYDDSYEQPTMTNRPRGIERAATDSALLDLREGSIRSISGSSMSSMPPPVPPKDGTNARASREQLILEKRREKRAAENNFIPIRGNGQRLQSQLGLGRPSKRRSMSTGDAQDLTRNSGFLDAGTMDKLTEEDLLSDSIERELRKLIDGSVTKKTRKQKYHVREHEGTIYASGPEEKISHMSGAGDLDSGRAWRTVRRPSDMNEYSKQIKEYRAQANPSKAYGKVFVKVLGIKGVNVPLPQQPASLTCTLNNGIHFVTTPECELHPDCPIEQEFELIEHSKLEFTLTLKIRRDPHIIAQFKALAPAPAPPPPPLVVQQSSSRGGVRAFFSSSPKKPSKEKDKPMRLPVQPPVHRLPDNLARYLKPDGTLARAFIQFKDIASRCDTRLFETSYPLIGQRVELGGKFSTLQVGEIVLQMFRLPPLPGIPTDQLPQSLEECHRGLRHINWHKMTYFQGTLTQSGGDCSTWRRRHFRVIGANLVAFNDVTKKATATIDLKKALAVQDDQELHNPHSPLPRSKGYDDDGLFGVERSFRLIFPQEQEIIFFADTDDEKMKWLDVLRALVGHIPPHPLWAELLWQRQEEAAKRPPIPSHNNSASAVQDAAGWSRQR